ncbi:phenylacetate--CoA ligase family protein [Amycolatopsis sp. NPDC059021]|uniref:phenylacetate--CoA ligase family protein n=1 Tax=Amycolatopsis sp. NPDC059021 TaxID=3346704 RepID=UPI003671347A
MHESVAGRLWEANRIRRAGPTAMAARQRERLAAQVEFARRNSPLYHRLYRNLPDRVTDPALLPVTSKKTLMPEFGDWVTDRAITAERARAFAADPATAGERFADHYTLVTTSGTTGTPGIFVVDERALTVNVALAGRMRASWLGAADAAKVLARGARMAMVVATGGHFLVAAGSQRVFDHSWTAKAVRTFSAHAPIDELVAGLNAFRPAILIGYASVLSLLAREQEAGRLRIGPVLVEPAGEALSPAERARLGTSFAAKVRDTYGSTECPFLTDGCAAGWYHVNTDWAIAEPVDADHRPVPPGELSHTVLITNLANRVQPILRYDLGDRVRQRPDPCPCGNPLPAFRVQGRVADLLTVGNVTIPPLLLNTVVDRVPGVRQFQIVQTAPAALRVRLAYGPGADIEQVWREVRAGLVKTLGPDVVLDRATEPPEQGAGGKFRPVIPLPQEKVHDH